VPGGQLTQRAAVFVREDLDELAAVFVPALEDLPRLRAAGEARVALDQAARDGFVRLALMPKFACELRLLL